MAINLTQKLAYKVERGQQVSVASYVTFLYKHVHHGPLSAANTHIHVHHGPLSAANIYIYMYIEKFTPI